MYLGGDTPAWLGRYPCYGWVGTLLLSGGESPVLGGGSPVLDGKVLLLWHGQGGTLILAGGILPPLLRGNPVLAEGGTPILVWSTPLQKGAVTRDLSAPTSKGPRIKDWGSPMLTGRHLQPHIILCMRAATIAPEKKCLILL